MAWDHCQPKLYSFQPSSLGLGKKFGLALHGSAQYSTIIPNDVAARLMEVSKGENE